MEKSHEPVKSASRRRDGTLLDAIYTAVLSELTERGYQGVTFEGVAKRAHTSKPVLYRRFPTRAELVAAALYAREPLPTAPKASGSLRDQLLALFQLHKARYDRLGVGVTRGLLAELPQERSNEILDSGMQVMLPTIRDIVSRAPELGTAHVPDTVLAIPIAILRHEFLTLGRVPKKDEIEDLLDLVYIPLLKLHAAGTDQ